MKITSVLFFLTFLCVDSFLAQHVSESNQGASSAFVTASLDGNILYVLVSAGLLGIIRIRKNAN